MYICMYILTYVCMYVLGMYVSHYVVLVDLELDA